MPDPDPATSDARSEALAALARDAAACTACDLYQRATHVVFGSGAPGAPLMLVGEQPGDREDLIGVPFVGPAGRVLDEALAEAGIDRDHVFVTNVVKHFRFETRGKLRLHKTPSARQVEACRPWLDRELRLVEPRVVVALGATAAHALVGRSFSVTAEHGQVREGADGRLLTATIHPSAVLRAGPDRPALFALLRDDLASVRSLAGLGP